MWVKGMLNESCPCCWQYWVAACLGVCPGDCGPLALPLPLVLKPGGSGKGKTGLVGSPPSVTPPFTWIVVVEVIHEAGGAPFLVIFRIDMTPGRIVPHHQFTT